MHAEQIMEASAMPTSSRRKPRHRRKRLDGRTRVVRRIRALTASYLAALDRPASPELRDRSERVAQLVVLGEEARRKALAGGVTIDDVVRIENAGERARRQLGLDDRRRQATQDVPSLADCLAIGGPMVDTSA